MKNIEQLSDSELIININNERYYINAYINEDELPQISYIKILKVKVLKALYNKWYVNKINEIFDAIELKDYYDCIGENGVFEKDDIEVLN
jgi:hypothetical protein